MEISGFKVSQLTGVLKWADAAIPGDIKELADKFEGYEKTLLLNIENKVPADIPRMILTKRLEGSEIKIELSQERVTITQGFSVNTPNQYSSYVDSFKGDWQNLVKIFVAEKFKKSKIGFFVQTFIEDSVGIKSLIEHQLHENSILKSAGNKKWRLQLQRETQQDLSFRGVVYADFVKNWILSTDYDADESNKRMGLLLDINNFQSGDDIAIDVICDLFKQEYQLLVESINTPATV